MPEEIKNEAAETTEQGNGSEVDVNAGADNNTDTGSENVNDADFSDGGADEEGTAQAPTETADEGKPQTKEQNSENARRRREAERRSELEKARREAREQAIIETLGGKNPYTGEEIKDSTDVAEYLTMREIEKSGGDPLTDYAKHVKAKEKEAIAKEEKEKESKAWYTSDRERFVKAHPEVNIAELVGDENFQKFADGKVGRVPLSKIYEDFISFTENYDKKAEAKAKQLLANKKASVGSLGSANPGGDGFFTREQVQKMTQEEVHENYDKIRASMKKWK